MFTPPTTSYFTLKLGHSVIEELLGRISPGTILDIQELRLHSDDFDSDITTNIALNEALVALSSFTGTDKQEQLNPMYTLESEEVLATAFDVETSGDARFIALDGDPFVSRKVQLGDIVASVTFRAFELPTYTEVVNARRTSRIN